MLDGSVVVISQLVHAVGVRIAKAVDFVDDEVVGVLVGAAELVCLVEMVVELFIALIALKEAEALLLIGAHIDVEY